MDRDDGDDGSVDPVAIVERVFRGRRVDMGRPAAAQVDPTAGSHEDS
jgi:hypothetical protein